ncbi:alpha-L-fucosidase 2-like isoform X2 [Tasmannia lanceolata]|uniref:alpha-L-fucosidase 2-like isoform X2 n=1 Tax=Tasmannia lanceolata TaxID=3420 RepID=UPI0040631FD8
MEVEEGEWVLVPDQASTTNIDDEILTVDEPLKVLFSAPAKHWTDAVPIGNGRLGAMVWGGVASEKIQLNDDTLWTGVPGNYTNSNAPTFLSKVRELVDNGKYAEATTAAVDLIDHPSEVYQPLGDINIEFSDSDVKYEEETYERELDLDTATVKVKYARGNVEFTREHFSSNPHQVIVTRISSNVSGSISFTVYLDSKLHHQSHVNGENQIIMEGSCPGKRIPPKGNSDENPKGIQFSAVLELRISDDVGVIKIIEGRKVKVEGANWAVLLLATSSSFDGPFIRPSDSTKDPTKASLDILNSIRKMSYSELYAYHLDDYQKLFHRVSLNLSKSSNNARGEERTTFSTDTHVKKRTNFSSEDINGVVISTAERVKSFKDDEDPSLVALLFHYGRYLLISCSRPGTQVSNLQGIWNKDIEPAWDGAPHLNINLQMNYWPSLSCNLSECQEPLFDYVSSLSVNGSKTAKVNYEARGWVAHHVSDIWAKTSPHGGEVVYALWQMGGAWLCTHLWEHYTFSMDTAFLKNKAYPLLEGCASFLLDWLIEGRGDYLETNPSTSPEHTFIAPDGKSASVSYSSTMDMAIIREIFSAIISAAEVLGRSKNELVEKVRAAQLKLYPTKIARDGSIMEWAQDFEDPAVHHRHLSHLFGLFPGHTIVLEKTPDLCKAAANSLYKRGEDGPGWSTTWKMACWARLHNSEHAYRMTKHLINLVDPDHEVAFEGGLYSNLFTAHPPFQIDANFGFTAAIAEMLVQSTERDLYLLPALPRDKWPSGRVKGLKGRGGVTVNISWNEGKLHEVGLWATNQNSMRRLHYDGTVATITLSAGKIYTFNKQLKCFKTRSLS